ADSAAPQSGQNLPPCVLAPHCGQTAPETCAMSRDLVQSTCRAFSCTCSRAASACAAAISSSRSGAQFSHSPAFLFQQTGSQTQLPQRVHCLKMGEISSTASFSAPSCAPPPTARCTSYELSATLPKMPPNRLPAARAAEPSTPMVDEV